MAGSDARASLGAMEAVVRGRARRQEQSAELQFRLVWDVPPTDLQHDAHECVETRTRDRASMGVGQVGMEDG
jgi:hypothetical protein